MCRIGRLVIRRGVYQEGGGGVTCGMTMSDGSGKIKWGRLLVGLGVTLRGAPDINGCDQGGGGSANIGVGKGNTGLITGVICTLGDAVADAKGDLGDKM